MTDTPDIALIVGMGRSGTTFFAKILDSAPNVLYRHEPDYTNINTEIPFLPKSEEIEAYVSKAEAYLHALVHQRDARTSGTRPIFSKSFRSGYGNSAFFISALTAKIASRVGLSVNVPDFVRANESAIHVIKSVNSLCRTELFLRAMPEMRVLHIIRHPCAVIASRLRGLQKGLLKDHIYTDALFNSGITEGCGFERETIKRKPWDEQAAFQWMVTNNFVFCRLNQDHRYMLISYENLCTSVMESARAVFAFSGVSWTAQTESFLHQLMGYENKTGGYFSIKNDLNSSLFNWKREIPAKRIVAIEELISKSSIGDWIFADKSQTQLEQLPSIFGVKSS